MNYSDIKNEEDLEEFHDQFIWDHKVNRIENIPFYKKQYMDMCEEAIKKNPDRWEGMTAEDVFKYKRGLVEEYANKIIRRFPDPKSIRNIRLRKDVAKCFLFIGKMSRTQYLKLTRD